MRCKCGHYEQGHRWNVVKHTSCSTCLVCQRDHCTRTHLFQRCPCTQFEAVAA